MSKKEYCNYIQKTRAIEFLQGAPKQTNLNNIAKELDLTPLRFQQLFIDWAGVTPEEFFETISIAHTKRMLNNVQPTLFETASTKTVKLNEKSLEIERMTPEEFKNKGENLTISYSFSESLFGQVLVASTQKGICYMGFSDDDNLAFIDLKRRFPNAAFIQQTNELQQNTLKVFSLDWIGIEKVNLHINGTDFQFKVWEALLKIPFGSLTTYGEIAEGIQKPKAARAIGTAIGSNPIAFLIPCHRVVQATGGIGGYMWGAKLKSAIIEWEANLANK